MAERLSPEDAIAVVEAFWDLPDGGLFRLREGDYRPGIGQQFADTLMSIDVAEAGVLPRRLVSLTWMTATFMKWQVERVRERGGDVAKLESEITIVQNAVEHLLGTP
jgi:hypothetical protein